MHTIFYITFTFPNCIASPVFGSGIFAVGVLDAVPPFRRPDEDPLPGRIAGDMVAERRPFAELFPTIDNFEELLID